MRGSNTHKLIEGGSSDGLAFVLPEVRVFLCEEVEVDPLDKVLSAQAWRGERVVRGTQGCPPLTCGESM